MTFVFRVALSELYINTTIYVEVSKMPWFLIGLFVGCFIGVAVMALCNAVSNADKQSEKHSKDEIK